MKLRFHSMVLGAAVLAVAASAPAQDAKVVLKCKRTVAKETSKFVQAKTKLLDKCEGSVVAGKLPPSTVCLSETKTAAGIAKASVKLQAAIGKACCGADKSCGTADDLSVAVLGVDPSCPNTEGGTAPASACGDIIMSDPSDLGACAECVAEEQVDEAINLYYGALAPSDPAVDKVLNKCQQTIGKATAAFLGAKSKALLKCRDAVLNGKSAGPCPDPAAQTAIANAETKKVAAICKACGGDDKLCGGTCAAGSNTGAACKSDADCPQPGVCAGGSNNGGACTANANCPGGTCDLRADCTTDDLTIAQIGAPAQCPAITAGSPPTNRPNSTLATFVDCIDDVTADRVDCADAIGTPGVPFPTKCTIPTEPCTPSGSTVTVQVDYLAPSPIAGIAVALAYDEDKLAIPGSGEDAAARVIVQQGGIALSNDTDSTLFQSIADFSDFVGTNVFQVEFDTCTGGITAPDLACSVSSASDSNGAGVAGVTCSATVLP